MSEDPSQTAPTWLTERVTQGSPLRPVAPRTFSVLPAADAGAPYDRRAAVYDRVIGSSVYTRFTWGLPTDDFAKFIASSLASGSGGVALDVAAGSCLESAAAYRDNVRPTIVLDRSLAMLARGRKRVVAACGGDPDHVVYLQADALALPLRDGSIDSLVSHGAFHIFDAGEAAAREWRRVLAAAGSFHMSSLALAGRRGDRLLRALHRAGEVTDPRTPEQVSDAIAAAFGAPPALRRVGNFVFVSVDPPKR